MSAPVSPSGSVAKAAAMFSTKPVPPIPLSSKPEPLPKPLKPPSFSNNAPMNNNSTQRAFPTPPNNVNDSEVPRLFNITINNTNSTSTQQGSSPKGASNDGPQRAISPRNGSSIQLASSPSASQGAISPSSSRTNSPRNTPPLSPKSIRG